MWTRENVTLAVQTLIAVGFATITGYMWATGKAVPGELWTATTIILGNYFTTTRDVIIAGLRDTPS